MKTYEVEVLRTETVRYYQIVEALCDEEAEEKAREQLEANDWTCAYKGKGGNCIDADEQWYTSEMEPKEVMLKKIAEYVK